MVIKCNCCETKIEKPIDTYFARIYAKYEIFWCGANCAKKLIAYLDEHNINILK